MLFCSLQYNKPQGPDPVPESLLGVREREVVNHKRSLAAAQVTKLPAVGWGQAI